MISDMPIYREQEDVVAIYFLEQGQAAYVLPRFQNAAFVTIGESETFGLIDIVFRKIEIAAMDESEAKLADNGSYKHKFTCFTRKNSVILQFGMTDLRRMALEYKEVYDELFDEQAMLLEETLVIKRKAVRILEGKLDSESSHVKINRKSSSGKNRKRSSNNTGGKSNKTENVDF